MKVINLQTFLRNLLPALDAVGGNPTLRKGVETIANSLEPFVETDFDKFTAFLAKAEEYHRTGILPVVTTKGRATKPAVPKTDFAAVGGRLIELRTLGDQGASQREVVEQGWKDLNLESLKAGDWPLLAETLKLDIPGSVKTAKARAQFVHKHIARGYLPSASQIVDHVRALEAFAAAPDSTQEQLENRLVALNLEAFGAELLVEACSQLGLNLKRKKTAEAAIGAIRQRLTERKTSQMVNVV